MEVVLFTRGSALGTRLPVKVGELIMVEVVGIDQVYPAPADRIALKRPILTTWSVEDKNPNPITPVFVPFSFVCVDEKSPI